ncbi:Hypothetical_protein [Hexamita inflata]|uniref:Hypothetical_protein n=1 Tax=Hexamita inflata TaxID=28002 RepID=A0AA86NRA8_9EUKA|nr:Hypothetical protein HINF_LOCUS11484 [Hexamita inflata]
MCSCSIISLMWMQNDASVNMQHQQQCIEMQLIKLTSTTRVSTRGVASLRFRVPLHFTVLVWLKTRQSLLFICNPWSDVLEITEHLWSNFVVPPETGNGAGLSRRWMVQEPGQSAFSTGAICYLYGIYSYNSCQVSSCFTYVIYSYYLNTTKQRSHKISWFANLNYQIYLLGSKICLISGNYLLHFNYFQIENCYELNYKQLYDDQQSFTLQIVSLFQK